MTVKLADLESKLRSAWRAETAYDPSIWTKDRPSTGQCYVTAIIVQDNFGGDIVEVRVPDGRHYYNIIDGVDVDLTRDQFDTFEPLSEPKVVPVKPLSGRTKKRHQMLTNEI